MRVILTIGLSLLLGAAHADPLLFSELKDGILAQRDTIDRIGRVGEYFFTVPPLNRSDGTQRVAYIAQQVDLAMANHAALLDLIETTTVAVEHEEELARLFAALLDTHETLIAQQAYVQSIWETDTAEVEAFEREWASEEAMLSW